jgi:hypothetical protein
MQNVISDHLPEHIFLTLLALDDFQYVLSLHFKHSFTFKLIRQNMRIYKFIDDVLQLLETPSDFE